MESGSIEGLLKYVLHIYICIIISYAGFGGTSRR